MPTFYGDSVAIEKLISSENMGVLAAPPTIHFNAVSDRNTEEMEKVDRHVDQLEEDIEYFNQTLEQQKDLIKRVENKAESNLNMNIEQDKKIKSLEDAITNLNAHISWLEQRCNELEGQLSDKKVC